MHSKNLTHNMLKLQILFYVGAGLSRDCFEAARCDRGINPLLQITS
jgi:hypothetical protein